MLDIVKSCSHVNIAGEGLLAVADEPRIRKIMETPAWDGVDIDVEASRGQTEVRRHLVELTWESSGGGLQTTQVYFLDVLPKYGGIVSLE